MLIQVLALTLVFSGTRPMTFEDMFTMHRVSQVAVSPTSQHVLFRLQQADIEKNSYVNRIIWMDLATGKTRNMTPDGQSHSSPVWRPDGKAYAYVSGGQIFINPLDGSAPYQVCTQSGGGPVFSPDGKWLLFSGPVEGKGYGDHSGKRLESLMYRHWNEWTDQTKTHLFLVAASANGEAKDITPEANWVPPISLGTASDYQFSPDSREVVYVTNVDPVVAISTNNDLFTYQVDSGMTTKVTENGGVDAGPSYSPDGRYIAYESMARAGFEADQTVIWLYDRKQSTHTALSQSFADSAHELNWSKDSKQVYFTSEVQGARSIFSVDLKGTVTRLTEGAFDRLPVQNIQQQIVFLREETHYPAEVHLLDVKTKKVKKVSAFNDQRLAELDMQPWESFWFTATNGDKVQGFVVKPPGFDASRKYPMIYLIHGGPQGMWGNQFHYRWNAQMFAAPGYVAVLVNPHGSKGYGQPFCDAVSKDWGGLPYEDLMKGVDVACEQYPFIDKDRMGAAGASYGGYMVDWIAVHEHHFKALVSHNGVYNLPSMYGATEELWFPEWEFGGTYYENPELYEKWSPHRYAAGLKAPTLVVHSELDYRVPLNQGMELFTALQRQGVPSQWLYFPDEDHFVSKPKNARMWWQSIFNWFDHYLKQ
ncbi:MAG: S9 family peptidase [Acidobacteria bacterium]|nr:S9 family peptidase [Acidobacteriota bacterium]